MKVLIVLSTFLACSVGNAFVIPSSGSSSSSLAFSSYLDGLSPSDTDRSEASSSSSTVSSSLWTDLLALAAATGRGEFATDAQKDQARMLIASLEAENQTLEPCNQLRMMQGKWELLFSDTQLFRSSPFFMSGRAVCETQEQARQYDWFCDMHRAALAISNIGAVRQVISDERIVSEFETKAGAVPFLSDFTCFKYSGGWPVTIDGAIVSSADITPTADGKAWEIYMDTVEIKGSNLPGLRTVLDQGLKLSSRGLGDLLESSIESYTNPRPVFETTYLSESMRISRDQDGKVFVYGKLSSDSTPTDYSNVSADLGISKLWQGFNKNILGGGEGGESSS